MPGKAQLRISLLNPPANLSPLKFKSWLRAEAGQIQSLAKGPHDIIIVRMFLAHEVRMRIPSSDLDKLIKSLVAKHDNIQQIEVREVAHQLDFAGMAAAQDEASADMAAILEAARGGKSGGDDPGQQSTLH